MRRTKALAVAVTCVMSASMLNAVLAIAAAAQESTATLAQGRDIVAMPSIGRVIFVFLLIAGLAVGAAYALRRYSPSFARATSQQGSLRVIDRVALNANLRVHLVEAGGERILIAENRAGISMLQLRGAASDTVKNGSS